MRYPHYYPYKLDSILKTGCCVLTVQISPHCNLKTFNGLVLRQASRPRYSDLILGGLTLASQYDPAQKTSV